MLESLIIFSMCSFDVNNKNQSCLNLSRTLQKNDDFWLMFRRTRRFLTRAGVLVYIFDVFFDDIKLKFQVS